MTIDEIIDKNITIVDADSLCYIGSETNDSLNEHIGKVNSVINTIATVTKADYMLLILSEGRYFRHNLTESLSKELRYKANRKYSKKYVRLLKELLKDDYNAVSFPMVEADDIVSYFKNKYPNMTLSAIDSDVLYGNIGEHYNYKKEKFITVTEEESNQYFITSLISGQTKDNIKTPFPDNCGEYNRDLTIDKVFHGYIYGLNYLTLTGQNKVRDGLGISEGIKQFALNYRLLKLLKEDIDYTNEGLIIPEFPINKLISI